MYSFRIGSSGSNEKHPKQNLSYLWKKNKTKVINVIRQEIVSSRLKAATTVTVAVTVNYYTVALYDYYYNEEERSFFLLFNCCDKVHRRVNESFTWLFFCSSTEKTTVFKMECKNVLSIVSLKWAVIWAFHCLWNSLHHNPSHLLIIFSSASKFSESETKAKNPKEPMIDRREKREILHRFLIFFLCVMRGVNLE